jgi:glycosyltransferase involved in cell wall biosynthesis
MIIKIGIIVPNKNDGIYLQKCISSILNQKKQADEIILIDDNSTDNSIKIAENLLKDHFNYTIIHNTKTLGTMPTLNKGLLISKSDYLLFLSSNDYISENLIFQAHKDLSLIQKKVGIWSGLVNNVDINGESSKINLSPLISNESKYLNNDECIKKLEQIGNWFTGATALYHRSSLNEIGGFNKELEGLADYSAAIQLAARSGSFFSPKIYGYVRKHPNSLLENTLSRKDNAIKNIDIIIEDIKINAPKLNTLKFTKKLSARLLFAYERNRIELKYKNKINGNNSKIYNYIKSIIILYEYIKIRKLDIIWAIYYRSKTLLINTDN